MRTVVDGVEQYNSLYTGLGRYIATLNLGNTSGSWTHSALSTGIPEWQAFPVSEGTSAFAILQPVISVSGNTLTWTFPAQQAGEVPPQPVYLVVWVV